MEIKAVSELDPISTTQNHNPLIHNARRVLAGALITGVSAFGASERIATAAADQSSSSEPTEQSSTYNNNEDWPAIDASLDGTSNYANFCKEDRGLRGPIVRDIDATSDDRELKVNYVLQSLKSCNGYGQRTIKMYLETKRPGQTKFRAGDPEYVRTHAAKTKKNNLEIANTCRGTLVGRLVAKVSWKHIDGKTYYNTLRSKKQSVNC